MITTNSMKSQREAIQKKIEEIQEIAEELPEISLICRKQSDVYRYACKKTELIDGKKSIKKDIWGEKIHCYCSWQKETIINNT